MFTALFRHLQTLAARMMDRVRAHPVISLGLGLVLATWLIHRFVGFGEVGEFLLGRYEAQARIYVEPPQVYTRERLVNDRFRELNWLEARLRQLRSAEDEAASLRTTSSIGQQLTLIQKGVDPQSGAAEETQVPAAAVRQPLALDLNDAFNLELQRRVAVRSEIMNTLLDDGHDLGGATLYRLNFDVSVIPRADATGFGMVAIDVKAPPCAYPECDDRDDPTPSADLARQVRTDRALLDDWEQDLQVFLSKVYQDRIKPTPGSQLNDPFYGGAAPKERMAFNWYLKAQAMETFLDLVAGPNEPDKNNAPCEPGQAGNGWHCDPAQRRNAIRQTLDWPGSDSRLPAELSAGIEPVFHDAIGHFVSEIRATLHQQQLMLFMKRFDGIRNRCREFTKAKAKAKADGVPANQQDAGEGPSERCLAREKDPPDLPVDLRAVGIAIPNDAKADDWSRWLRALSGNRDTVNTSAAEDVKPDSDHIEQLMALVSDAPACRNLPRTVYPSWVQRESPELAVPCPERIDPELAKLHGLVQLSGRLERVRAELLRIRPEGPNLHTLARDEAGDVQRVAARMEQFYQCFFGASLLNPTKESSTPETTPPTTREQHCAALLAPPAVDPTSDAAAEAERAGSTNAGGEAIMRLLHRAEWERSADPASNKALIRSLFEKKFADFFVDRLRRNDIPGYQPSPPVDRFLAIKTSGCQTRSCDVTVMRKRWFTRELYGSIGRDLRDDLEQACGSHDAGPGVESPPERDGPEDPRVRCGTFLDAVLPMTSLRCSDDQQPRCFHLLNAILDAAQATETDRSVIAPLDGRSGFERFRDRLQDRFSERLADDGCNASANQGRDGRKSACTPTDLTPTDVRVAWDFIDSVNALEFGRELSALDGSTPVKVYAVEPRLRGAKSQAEIRRTERLRALLSAGSGTLTGAELQGNADAAQTLEQVTARNTVIGFGHLRGTYVSSEPSDGDLQHPVATFGWMFLPNRFEPGGWFGAKERATHESGSYRLSAVLSVPSWWTEVTLAFRQCWGLFGRVDDAVMTDPYAHQAKCDGQHFRSGLAPAGYTEFAVELPASTERITEEFEFEVTKVPYIDHRDPLLGQQPPTVEAGRRHQRIVIEGNRLWRGTMVTLGDQRADEIVVLPDMRGVVAKFDCVLPPPGKRHFTDFETTSLGARAPPDPVNAPSPTRLTVWTAQGNAWTWASITPFMQRTEGEQPCWLSDTEVRADPPQADSDEKRIDVPIRVLLDLAGRPNEPGTAEERPKGPAEQASGGGERDQ
jgi:hypothetical protein